MLSSFREYIEENKAEIIALQIIYDQKYQKRPMVIGQLKKLYEKLKARNITIGVCGNVIPLKKRKA